LGIKACARWIEMGLILVLAMPLALTCILKKKIPMLPGGYPFDTHWVSWEKTARGL